MKNILSIVVRPFPNVIPANQKVTVSRQIPQPPRQPTMAERVVQRADKLFGLDSKISHLSTHVLGKKFSLSEYLAARMETPPVHEVEVTEYKTPTMTLPPMWSQFRFSPNDLVNFYKSDVLSWLDRMSHHQRALGQKGLKKAKPDEAAQLFIDKGLKHEIDYLQILKDEGKTVYEVTTFHEDKSVSFEDSYQETLRAMKEGYDVVYQATLQKGQFGGYADFLIRVDNPPGVKSVIDGVELDYHYEVWDTKLSKKPKPEHILQLCSYADMLEEIQGIRPENIAVVVGTGAIVTLKTDAHFAYYLQLKKMFMDYQKGFDPKVMPEFGKGDYREWNETVKKMRLESDHLSQVAGISNLQSKRLRNAGIQTMTELAQTEIDDVPKMSDDMLERLKRQAQLQLESADKDKPVFEVINNQDQPEIGLGSLPPPSTNGMDVFFDIEGYPLQEGGLEYLLGAMTVENGKRDFFTFWSNNAEEEKHHFEAFIDWIHVRWQQDPTMHVYHYAAYEVSAMLRLASKHGTREKEVDELLANHVFVDLFKIVKKGLRVGTPSYSIKYIERLYRDERDGMVVNAISSVVEFDQYLETTDPEIKELLRENLENYNEDDCDSTVDLYDFLRAEQQKHGIDYHPPEIGGEQANDPAGRYDRSKYLPDKDTPKLIADLMHRYRDDIAKKTERGQTVELMIHMLNYYAREERVDMADKLRRSQMSEDELIEESNCLGGLTRMAEEPYPEKRSMIYTYEFDPDQETKLEAGKRCAVADNPDFSLTIHKIDFENGVIELKISKAMLKKFPREPRDNISLMPNDNIPPGHKHDTLYRIAMKLNSDDPTIKPVLNDLLYKRTPRIIDTAETQRTGQKVYRQGPIIKGDVYHMPDNRSENEAIQAVLNLDGSTLYTQGPPGSGKTTISAEEILTLIQNGKRVGISGPSHKAINNLLRKAVKLAQERGIPLNAVKVGKMDDDLKDMGVSQAKDSGEFYSYFSSSTQLVAGTPWLFAHEQAENEFDYVVVDEAGQIPIADAVALTWGTKNLLVVGDHKQNDHVVRGTHPKGSGESVFNFYLAQFGGQTIPDHAGIFLPTTYRMHPKITDFVSRNFYEGRLQSSHTTPYHILSKPTPEGDLLIMSGIFFIPVEHEDNRRSSIEEIKAIERFMASLKTYTLHETGPDGKTLTRPMTLADILIVAPYNAQVHLAKRNLEDGARVGTVDKFQGQEAQVTLISMSSSNASQSGRGLEFLMSPNRLNVAISRAKAVVGFFASPDLINMRAKTLKQWQLVNVVCEIMQGERLEAA